MIRNPSNIQPEQFESFARRGAVAVVQRITQHALAQMYELDAQVLPLVSFMDPSNQLQRAIDMTLEKSLSTIASNTSTVSNSSGVVTEYIVPVNCGSALVTRYEHQDPKPEVVYIGAFGPDVSALRGSKVIAAYLESHKK